MDSALAIALFMHSTLSPWYCLSYGHSGPRVVCSKLLYKTPSVRSPRLFRGATHSSHDRFIFRSSSTEKDPEFWLCEEVDGNGPGALIPEPAIPDLTGEIADPPLRYQQATGGNADVYCCPRKQTDGKWTRVS